MAIDTRNPHRRPLLLLLLVAVLIVSTVDNVAAKYANRNCPANMQTCSCNYIDVDYEIDCPPKEPDVSILVKHNGQVQIDCHSDRDTVYANLPLMQLGNITTIRFQKCPSPFGGTSYAAIMKQLGILNARTVLLFFGGSSLVRSHFAGFENLERLVLQKNGLTELPADLFADFKNLAWLNIGSNAVHLPVGIFDSLSKLKYLELGYNSLKSLRPGLFQGQKHLESLNLWGNNLTYLTQAELEGLESVLELDLSANMLETMEVGVFDGLTRLNHVHLSSNPIRELPSGLLAKTNLSEFALRDNRATMESLPAEFFANLPSMEKVVMEECGLKALPKGLFANSTMVLKVSFAHNKLEMLEKGVFDGMARLTELDLSSNELTLVEDGIFETQESLKVLRLTDNRLTDISE